MKMESLTYNNGHDVTKECLMPKRKIPALKETESFGRRLARLRQAAGYSQREFAAEAGISQRMVAYYEKETAHAPSHLLPILAKALGVSLEQLLGLEKVKDNGRRRDTRLWRRFGQVEKLPPAQRKPVVQFLDAFLKSQQLKTN